MDLSQIVNPVSEPLLHRSPSVSHSNILAPSPGLSSATLPATPTPRHSMSSSASGMNRKRKRGISTPIWAVRESEVFDGKTLQQDINERQRQQPKKPPPQPQPQPQPQPHARPPPSASHPPPPSRNGHSQPPPPSASQPTSSAALAGLERPISYDPRVYDEIQRYVCDFIYDNVIHNPKIRELLVDAPETTVEVEARWGHIVNRNTQARLTGFHATECMIRTDVSKSTTRFESVMNVKQHQKMNNYLNGEVAKSVSSNAQGRPKIGYKHTKVVDQQYVLDDAAMSRLSPAVQNTLKRGGKQERIRVSRDQKTGEEVAAIIKHKVNNVEISSPMTEWDYRIGVNLEIAFPGPLDGLVEVAEKGLSVEAGKRYKDRMSYSYLDSYQIDLTQVTQGNNRIHELELELDSDMLLQHGDRLLNKQPTEYEAMINGMINNLRVLSREITRM